ncbi:MAG: hypothetical protein JGK17_29160 [Microcoleus sp. PH2017_10_PVI_O_A]|nr:hypothetical protein [Microcoleus sp. PH2017_10_PVI_O_A]MCC3482138.1 hypothetical protein [Microcoleus sp. PH2017_12_PCY_D_A]MCC3531552.1 hypothetical protein [Microcoleus sp. PH2017_21_RUC_O_A]MCC3543852.1 hypothetical protein [Microcoleus sp. PH2017_22_RUC_O_B]
MSVSHNPATFCKKAHKLSSHLLLSFFYRSPCQIIYFVIHYFREIATSHLGIFLPHLGSASHQNIRIKSYQYRRKLISHNFSLDAQIRDFYLLN